MPKPKKPKRTPDVTALRARPPRRKGLKAAYGDATPEDVARALLRPRNRPQRPSST